MSWTHFADKETGIGRFSQRLSHVCRVGDGATARTQVSSPGHRLPAAFAQTPHYTLGLGHRTAPTLRTVISTVVFPNIVHKTQVLLVVNSLLWKKKKKKFRGQIILGNTGLKRNETVPFHNYECVHLQSLPFPNQGALSLGGPHTHLCTQIPHRSRFSAMLTQCHSTPTAEKACVDCLMGLTIRPPESPGPPQSVKLL